MELILLEKIKRLGDLGETVKVKPGYGRNYLLPRGMALPATEANRKVFEERKAELMKKAQDSISAAKMRAGKIDGLSLTVPMLVSEEGKLYGSVGVSEIVRKAAEVGVEIDRHEVELPEGPIHAVGSFEVVVRVHSDVEARLTVVVEEARA